MGLESSGCSERRPDISGVCRAGPVFRDRKRRRRRVQQLDVFLPRGRPVRHRGRGHPAIGRRRKSAGGTRWAAETAWPQSGGGYVSGTPIPAWQQLAGVVNASNQGSSTLRNSPDVAAEADFDNPTVINGSFVTGYGGTSFATPRWAGFLALVNQQSAANGKGTVGFINPALYEIGVSSSYAGCIARHHERQQPAHVGRRQRLQCRSGLRSGHRLGQPGRSGFDQSAGREQCEPGRGGTGCGSAAGHRYSMCIPRTGRARHSRPRTGANAGSGLRRWPACPPPTGITEP